MKTEKSDYVCPNCGHRKPARPAFPWRLSGVVAPPAFMVGIFDRLLRSFCPRCGTKMKKEKKK